MDRSLKGTIEVLSEYIRFHPNLPYSLSSADDGDFILTFYEKGGDADGKRLQSSTKK